MKWLVERFEQAGDRTAFIHNDREVTYQNLVEMVQLSQAQIATHGIVEGDLVVVFGDYSPELYALLLAVALSGAIAIPLTANSIVEESAALATSGSDWRIDFSGSEVIFQRRILKVQNDLIEGFRNRKSAGLILFTSGSTGKTKGILHDFNIVAEKFRKARDPISAIPFLAVDHFGGINTLLAITASLGTIVTVADRSVANICSAIGRYKIELLPTTPSFLTLLLASRLHREFDLSSLKKITYGTEVMPQSTLDRLRAEFPKVVLQQTYGLSEVGVLSSQSRDDGSTWIRLGGAGFKTKVEEGVLWIKSEYAMVGYLNAPNIFDSEGWFNTQDLVEVDGEFFKILGRTTDIINVGGQKVYPAEVESEILKIDNVKDVAVFGEANGLLGQIVVAKVLLKQPEPLQEVKRLVRKTCRERLASYKIPAKVIIADGNLYSVRQKKIRA